MTPEELQIAKLRYLLYEAIVELEYVQASEDHSLCASAKGREIVERGMKLLEVKDLSQEHLVAKTAPPPYEPAFGDPSFWPVLLSHVMGGSIRQLASAEKMVRAQVECTAPAPQLGRCPLCGSDKPDSFLGICATYNEQNEPAHIFHWASTSDSHRAKMRGRVATPQVTPWKSHFTDSDVTGDIHNYVDTGDGKRLWAQDADEIVKRHNEGRSEQASPTPELGTCQDHHATITPSTPHARTPYCCEWRAGEVERG